MKNEKKKIKKKYKLKVKSIVILSPNNIEIEKFLCLVL